MQGGYIDQGADPSRIYLALSGGGFRATLFHIGVIRRLHELKLLSKVVKVTSVSGGSILAAHLILNWDRYTGSDEDFDSAASEVVEFTQIDVRGKITRRWILGSLLVLPRLFKRFTFANSMSALLSKLYRGAKLVDISVDSAPELHILATSLTTGGQCKFTGSGFCWADLDGREHLIRTGDVPVSKAVAASSAFPPLFPPVPIDAKVLNADSKQFPNSQALADGGIYDNLGLQELLKISLSDTQRPDLIILSDAGSNFDWSNQDYKGVIRRNIRSTDILMNRVSELVPSGKEMADVNLCHVSIGLELPPKAKIPAQQPEIQRAVRNIRTDLDRFSFREVGALLKQGYSAACHFLGPGSSETAHFPTSWDRFSSRRDIRIRISRAKRRRLRLVAWDVVTALNLLTVLLWLAITGVLPLALAFRAGVKTANQNQPTKIEPYTYLGQVIDDKGQPVVGVHVTVYCNRVMTGAHTDVNGYFATSMGVESHPKGCDLYIDDDDYYYHEVTGADGLQAIKLNPSDKRLIDKSH